MVLPRVLTALFLLPVAIAGIWYGSLPYLLLVFGVCFLCMWEYCLIADHGGFPNQMIMSFIGCGGLLLALYLDGTTLNGPIHHTPGPLFIYIFWLFLVFVRELFSRDKGHSFLRIISTIGGVTICALLLGHLLLLRDLRIVEGEGFRYVGRELVFFLFITVWIVDSGAWLFGRWLGRTPLAPRLSPKKTWEGSIAGTLLACGAGVFMREVFLKGSLGLGESIVFALIIAVTAQISDLVESLLKRSFGVKNSSELLPGHGGLLDRFDSFIFAAPFFYYILLGTGRFH